MSDKTITLSLMDPPYDSETTTTALRIAEAALDKGISVNVFAYEGAVMLTMKAQQAHPNPVKGTTVEDQHHPTTAGFVGALFEKAAGDVQFQWINCGLCADERGANDAVPGPVRGSPKEFVEWINGSDQTLVIPAK